MAYENQLETWWATLPGEIHSVFGWAFDEVNGWLEAVAGDPDDLVRAGGVYGQIGPQINELGDRMLTDAQGLAPSWEGDAFVAFERRVAHLQESMTSIGEGVAGTQEILEAAAQAAVEGANLIIDIFVMVIEFALYSLAVAAATAIISLGASLVAWAATQAAQAAIAMSRVMAVVQKVAVLLQRVALLLQRIARIMYRIAAIFREWALMVRSFKALPQGRSAAAIGAWAQGKVITALIAKIDGLFLPMLPSGVTHGLPQVADGLGDVGDSVRRTEEAADDAAD